MSLYQCHLYQKSKLTTEDIQLEPTFELLKKFSEESHERRYLLRCRKCGWLYFYDFSEEVDWAQGNDAQLSTFIPVKSESEAEELAGLSALELLKYRPRIEKIFPSSATAPTVTWVGKY